MTTWVSTIDIPEETRGYGENKRVLPAQRVKIELTINLAQLMDSLGRKAARSKGGKSKAYAGLIVAKMLQRGPKP